MCPAFEDFYRYHKVDKGDLPEGCDPEHDSPMSVMRFHELLAAGNPNCIEMLFSVERDVKVKGFETYLELMRMAYAGGYAALVWDGFYSALTGLALNGLDRNGVTPKTLARARYFYGMALHVAGNGFVIDEGTYRSGVGEDAPEFHLMAKMLRFYPPGKGSLEESAENLRAAFSRDKAALSRKATEFCAKNRMKMADMRASMDMLGVTLRDLVYVEVQQERADRYYKSLSREMMRKYLER